MNAPGTIRERLKDYLDLGVSACLPNTCLARHLPGTPPIGRTLVLGAGKAAATMAGTVHASLDYPVEGLVVTRYGHNLGQPTGDIRVVEAAHPVPDARSQEVAEEMLFLASGATARDRVLFLISGGGSALLMAPIEGVSLALKREITTHLLKSGAPIEAMNLVRKHLSRIKGGGLSEAAAQAQQITYVISDVVGDSPDLVASGPSLAFTREPGRAIEVLETYGWKVDAALSDAIHKAAGSRARPHEVHTVATGATALTAIQARLGRDGFQVLNLGSHVEGTAQTAALLHLDLMLKRREKGPFAIISGGEVTVEVRSSKGRGGRNLEFLAALMQAAPAGLSYSALACDSDGIDGTEDNAGAFLDASSRQRAERLGLNIEALRAGNNTYGLFEGLGDLICTGPTGTNVNDIRIILMDPS